MHMNLGEFVSSARCHVVILAEEVLSHIFFFSSRRRHTRYWRDWSSDVCSSDLKGEVASLRTEWIPMANVPAVSDRGDVVFERLRSSSGWRSLEAEWLASAESPALVAGLSDLIAAYREWIGREQGRVDGLPKNLQPQARKHIERCTTGADRMAESVVAIRDDRTVRQAFQLAQRAMGQQF